LKDDGALIFFLFDLLHLDGETISAKPVKERKERPHAGSAATILPSPGWAGAALYEQACALKFCPQSTEYRRRVLWPDLPQRRNRNVYRINNY
jgi:hypothetical protein